MGRGKNTKYDEKTGKVTLVIDDLGPGDEGQYECRADNPYGDSTCTIMVSKQSRLCHNNRFCDENKNAVRIYYFRSVQNFPSRALKFFQKVPAEPT